MRKSILAICIALLLFPQVVLALTQVTVGNSNCGAPCDYASLALAEDGEDDSISDNLEIVCYPILDESTVIVAGFIGSYDVTIRGSEALGTSWDNNKYRLNPSANATHGIDNWIHNVYFKDLQIYNDSTNTTNTFNMTHGYSTDIVQIERCILAQGDRSPGAGYNIRVDGVNPFFSVRNSILYVEDYASGGQSNLAFTGGATSELEFINNTVYDGWYGAYIVTYGDVTVYNNIFQDCEQAVSYLINGTDDMDYNICEDDDCTDGAYDQEEEVEFVDEANYDFGLEADTFGDQEGYNFTASFTYDVEQDSRPSTGYWDIGADEN